MKLPGHRGEPKRASRKGRAEKSEPRRASREERAENCDRIRKSGAERPSIRFPHVPLGSLFSARPSSLFRSF